MFKGSEMSSTFVSKSEILNDFILEDLFYKHLNALVKQKRMLRLHRKEEHITYSKGDDGNWSTRCKDPLPIDKSTKCQLKPGSNYSWELDVIEQKTGKRRVFNFEEPN